MASTFQIIMYVLLIILIIIGIIGGIKLILTIDKVNALVDDVNKKVKSLDKLFEIVDFATDRMSMVTEAVISFISTGLKKLFSFTKKSKKSKEEDEIDE